jgi:hypothetical protein
VETKTSHVFEAIVYFRHYVIGIHKFVLIMVVFLRKQRWIHPNLIYPHFASTIYDKSGLLGGRVS